MKNLKIHIEVHPDLYTKNPDSSELGQKIISHSISLINEIGFELFTFKKLGQIIKSPESSIYRYFENKHKLLIYLTSWYWRWTEYRLAFALTNIESATKRLQIAIDILTREVLIDNDISYVNEIKLSKIIFSESIKTYHTKNVEKENSNGSFQAYKSVVNTVSNIVLEIDSSYKYPHMLISTVIEGAHQQKYFSEHLPSLTDVVKEKDDITIFYKEMVFSLLQKNNSTY